MIVSLVVNPAAGSRKRGNLKIIEDLLARKVSFTKFATREKGDAFRFARDVSHTNMIIVAGGDGTVNEVVNGLLSRGDSRTVRRSVPIALIPIGTSNVLARELGIPNDIEGAVNHALCGNPKKISLGRINGRYFTLMAGIGFDAETVLGVKDWIKRTVGKGAYIYSGIRTLAGYRPPLIEVRMQKEIFSGFAVVAGNARYYAGGFQVTPGAGIDEPFIDICILKSGTRQGLLRFIAGVVLKKHLESGDVEYRSVRKLEVSSRETVHVQTDGDYFGTLPVKLEVERDAVSIVHGAGAGH